MKSHLMRSAAVLTLAALLLTGSASALFGKKAEETPPAGAPQVPNLELRTYRDIPGQGQFQTTALEGEEVTFTLAEEGVLPKVFETQSHAGYLNDWLS